MPFIPLNIPPEFTKTETDLQASGRWADANLVRWHEGTMQPFGGWRNRSDNAALSDQRLIRLEIEHWRKVRCGWHL